MRWLTTASPPDLSKKEKALLRRQMINDIFVATEILAKHDENTITALKKWFQKWSATRNCSITRFTFALPRIHGTMHVTRRTQPDHYYLRTRQSALIISDWFFQFHHVDDGLLTAILSENCRESNIAYHFQYKRTGSLRCSPILSCRLDHAQWRFVLKCAHIRFSATFSLRNRC